MGALGHRGLCLSVHPTLLHTDAWDPEPWDTGAQPDPRRPLNRNRRKVLWTSLRPTYIYPANLNEPKLDNGDLVLNCPS